MPLAMPFVRYVHLLIVGAALCLVAAPTARAQQLTQGTILATRESLRDELARLERAGASGQAGSALIRTRLEADLERRALARRDGTRLLDRPAQSSRGRPPLCAHAG